MIMLRIMFASLYWLVAASTADAEIFKWVDEQGNVHFGDCPPADCKSGEVEVEPGPSQQAIQEARDRAEKLRAYEKAMREARRDAAGRREARLTASAPVSHAEDPACFIALGDAWGGKIADTRKSVSRKALTRGEYRYLQNLLDSLAGRWRGTVDEITCVRPDAKPPTKTDRYRVQLRGKWKSSQVLEVEANLVGVENRAVLREFFWFLSSRNGLRFRKANTDIAFNIDQPGNDVETLMIASDSLRFVWRRGGALRKANVLELRKEAGGFRFREFFYVQGTLAGKRAWELSR